LLFETPNQSNQKCSTSDVLYLLPDLVKRFTYAYIPTQITIHFTGRFVSEAKLW